MSRKKKAPQGFQVVEFARTFSHSMKWDRDGRCFEQINDGPTAQRPDMDFGTTNGDLLIDPWIQDAIRDSNKT